MQFSFKRCFMTPSLKKKIILILVHIPRGKLSFSLFLFAFKVHFHKAKKKEFECFTFKNNEINNQSFQSSPGTSCWIVCTTLVFKTNWGGRGGWSFYTKMPRQPQPYHPPPPNAHVCYAAAGLRENTA